MYIYTVHNQETLGQWGIFVLADSIKQVKQKYTDCSVGRWCSASKKTIKRMMFADDLTGITDRHLEYKPL